MTTEFDSIVNPVGNLTAIGMSLSLKQVLMDNRYIGAFVKSGHVIDSPGAPIERSESFGYLETWKPALERTLEICKPYIMDSWSSNGAQMATFPFGDAFKQASKSIFFSSLIVLHCVLASSLITLACNTKFVERISSASFSIVTRSASNFAARSFAWPASFSATPALSIAAETSLSDFAASINSIASPRISRIAENLLARASRPFMSFQSQITSPATPSKTITNPGCLFPSSKQKNRVDEAKIILRN